MVLDMAEICYNRLRRRVYRHKKHFALISGINKLNNLLFLHFDP